MQLAKAVVDACSLPSHFRFLFSIVLTDFCERTVVYS